MAGVTWILAALVAYQYRHLALGVLIVAAIVIAVGAQWLQRQGVLRGTTPGVNLEARRGTPAVWLVAHLDSKSQPVPILVRAAAIVASVITWGAMVAMAAFQVQAGWHAITLAAVIAGLPVAISTVGAASPGALDNATGVATVLMVAERIDRSVPLGVLITSAEELGLAGSRAWVRALGTKALVINCDTIDDHGYLSIMHSHGRPERLIRAFEQAGLRARRSRAHANRFPDSREARIRARGVLPGILVDSVAFAEAGWDAVTVSRGTLATLARIHRRADTPDRLTGRGVAEVANIIAEALLDV